MYSAIKKNGVKLYELARKGITVARPPREVHISALHITAWKHPLLGITVKCGPGTYIRALARDIGTALGCGAHLSELRRTQSGSFSVEQAVTLKQLELAFAAGTEQTWLHPLDKAVDRLPSIHLDQNSAFRLAQGQPINAASNAVAGAQARAYGPGNRFIALVKRGPQSSSWQPIKVFVRPSAILVSDN
jgi:tRNA pseudouridine55 synthase